MNLNSIFEQVDFDIRNAQYDGAFKKLLELEPIAQECRRALSKIESIKEGNIEIESSVIILLNFSGFLIDIGSAQKNNENLEYGIKIAKEVQVKLDENHRLYSNYCYNIANGISGLIQNIQHSSEEYYLIGSKLPEEAKKFYRLIIPKINKNDRFLLPILTNYANLLNGRFGRIIESLHFYNKALSLDPTFAMALANKGYVQSLFAYVIDERAKAVLLHEAYVNITIAIKKGLDLGPKKYFQSIITDIIEPIYPDVSLNGYDISCKGKLKNRKTFEDFYRRFCIENDLYLNPLSNSHHCDAALYDPLIIKNMIVNKEEGKKYLRFSSYFNQIKQEYNFARYLAAQSFYKDPSSKFIDDDVVLIDTLEFSAYSIFLEQARASFRISYSILDKIAFIVNDYFNLGLKEREVSFRKLSNIRNKKILELLFPLRNPYLAAILDLANDFENDHFKNIRDLRNTFEHRFKNVHLFSFTNNIDPNISSAETDILTTKNFRNLLIELLIIIKSSIFYLALMIDFEERKKISEIDDSKIAVIPIADLTNELKGGF